MMQAYLRRRQEIIWYDISRDLCLRILVVRFLRLLVQQRLPDRIRLQSIHRVELELQSMDDEYCRSEVCSATRTVRSCSTRVGRYLVTGGYDNLWNLQLCKQMFGPRLCLQKSSALALALAKPSLVRSLAACSHLVSSATTYLAYCGSVAAVYCDMH